MRQKQNSSKTSSGKKGTSPNGRKSSQSGRSKGQSSQSQKRGVSRFPSKDNVKKNSNATKDFALLDGDAIIGKIEGNPNGFAFLIRDDLAKDVYISPRSLGGALHGDKVAAIIREKANGGFDATVTEIIEPCIRELLGTYVTNTSTRGFVIPDDKRIAVDIDVEQKYSMGASNGDRVLVKIVSRKSNPIGKITRVFKNSENIDFDILSVLLSYNLSTEFSDQVNRETAKIPETLTEAELKGRKDFRDTICVTIDGDDSRDFDDAVGLVKTENGYELAVHIADVAHYVHAGSHLDKEAFARGTSVYFPSFFIPMLPEKICNNLCSLMENHDRLTLSVIMQISEDGQLRKHRITNGVIRSARRLTYSIVEKILEGDEEASKKHSDLVPMLKQMGELSKILSKRRKQRGSIDFDLPESQIIVNQDGKVEDVRRAPRLTSHRLIEEFMLITNETVAELMSKALAPFVYRGHLPPNDLKMDAFTDFLTAVNIMWDKSEPVVPMDYSRLLEDLPENLTNIVNMMALRSMTKAAYFPQNKGHFGLASEFYCHFTAPIRRYPDLIIHRIIKDYLENGKKCFKNYTEIVGEASTQSSLTERKADEAERDIEDIYKARFMSEKIGEVFEGIISGITEWGIYVQLENTIEGLVRKESLPGGEYAYNPIIMSLSNMSYIFKTGDKMTVKVQSVTKNKIDFEPIIESTINPTIQPTI